MDTDFQMQTIKFLFKEDTLMNTTAELKIEISNARIRNAIVLPDGSCKLKLELVSSTQEQYKKDDCILVEASKLSLSDDFMLFVPKTDNEKKIKAALTELIKTGIKDFYRPVMDPSFVNKACTIIGYKAGDYPATGKSYNWWEETVKDSQWCLGTKAQYVAFLGVLIKMLVAKGWKCREAWNAVCNDSKKLGHYRNSDNSMYDLEHTGSREICGFFDLANTCKILSKDEEMGGFWLAGGNCTDNGNSYPLADLVLCKDYDSCHNKSVGWLVCKKEI